MTGVCLTRLQEHLDCCHRALTNVGADGLNQLQMHLRLAVEWAVNLKNDLARENHQIPQETVVALSQFANLAIQLDATTVLALPAAIDKVRVAFRQDSLFS